MSFLLREYIKETLREMDEKATLDVATSLPTKKEIENVINSGAYPDIHTVRTKYGEDFRIVFDDMDENKKDALVTDVFKSIFGKDSVISITDLGKKHSGTYNTKLVDVRFEDSGVQYNIVFSGKLSSGQRGGGYEYENKIKQRLIGAGVNVIDVGADTAKSDVFVETTRGPIGIEVKAALAKFGQPTFYYDYESKQFISASRTKTEVEKTRVNKQFAILMATEGNEAWLKKIKDVWEAIHGEGTMKKLDRQITPEDWSKMRAAGVVQKGESVEIPIDLLSSYYVNKAADYIQIQGKGLYAFTKDKLELGIDKFDAVTSGMTVNIRPEILSSNERMVIRGSVSVDMSGMKFSSLDLDSDNGLDKFAAAANKK